MTFPCVACDVNQMASMDVWRKGTDPVIVCRQCYDSIDRAVLYQLFILRKQTRHLYSEVQTLHATCDALREDFQELFDMVNEG